MRSMLRLFAVAIFACLAGCTPDIGGEDYSVVEAGGFQEIYKGKVTNRRTVKISNATVNEERGRQGLSGGASAGAGAGALAGGLIAGSASQSTGGTVAGALGGALLGGFLGHKADEASGSQKGYQYEINLDDGRHISVVQGLKPEINVGQRVVVVKGETDNNGRVISRTRVLPDTASQPAATAAKS